MTGGFSFQLQNWWRRIKKVRLIRLLAAPVKQIEIKCLYRRYLNSKWRMQIEELKDTHKGERCFVIGNGPSLRPEDLNKLAGEFTFAANRIFDIFDKTSWRPSVYMAVDEDFMRTEEARVLSVPCEYRLLTYVHFEKHRHEHEAGWQAASQNTILLWIGPKRFVVDSPKPWADKSACIPENLALGFSEGRTVTFDSIQLAIHMGFQEIYLIGVDFSYSRVIDEDGRVRNIDGVTDYFDQKTYDTSLQYYVPTKHAYEAARKYCDAHGIIIRNATRGGKLEVFERVELEDVLE